MPNFAATTLSCERLRRYREGRRRREISVPIKITDGQIGALVKRGYLELSERDDQSAILQAINLFVWDSIKNGQGSRRLTASGI